MAPTTFGHAAPDAHGRKVQLSIEGHVLNATIRREEGAEPEEGVPDVVAAGALIDTGASVVCIDYRIASALKLREINQCTVATLGGSSLVRVYMGVLEVPDLEFRRLMQLYALGVNRASYNIILGRAFLEDFIVTFDGPNGCCHFARPAEPHLEPWDDE